jgi:hypothetical protein
METLDNNLNQNTLSNTSKAFILETAKWAKFLAIVGFVMLGLMAIVVLFMLVAGVAFMNMSRSFGAGASGSMGMIAFIYIAMIVLYFFPTYYLYQFASKIKSGLLSGNDSNVDSGFENLKSTFKFMGIFMIVVLSLYGLALVFSVIGAAFI